LRPVPRHGRGAGPAPALSVSAQTRLTGRVPFFSFHDPRSGFSFFRWPHRGASVFLLPRMGGRFQPGRAGPAQRTGWWKKNGICR